MQRDDARAQRGHYVEPRVSDIDRVYAIKADAEAHIVILIFGAALYACGVEDMALKVIAYALTQGVCHARKSLELQIGVVIFVKAVSRSKMRERRGHSHSACGFEHASERRQLLGDKSYAVHAGVELDVYGVGILCSCRLGQVSEECL